jgi:hypothetical protein
MPATHNATGRARKNSGDIMLAPLATTSRPYPRRRNKISGQFAWQLIEMLASPAYRVLSQSAYRVLARIQIEHDHHGGKDNGRLPVTYEDFEAYGIERHAIAPAIRELEALGFIEVTERGRAGNAEFRSPNRFRLTFQPTQADQPTDKWRRFESVEQAEAVAKAARKSASKTKVQCGKKPVSVRSHTENANAPVRETPTTPIVGNPTLLSIVLGEGEELRAASDAGSAPLPHAEQDKAA